ncbi:S41 family peptidase [Spirosoma areae]
MNQSVNTYLLTRYGLPVVITMMLITCTPKSEPQPAETVKNFYEKLFQIVEQNSINRRKINWSYYKSTVWERVGTAKTVPETESAMRLAMALLKDNHSSILIDSKRTLYGGIGCQAPPALTPPFTLTDVGYIAVAGFTGTDLEGVQFAQAIQNDIARQDDKRLKGWIVDLRRNTGGNMYPMIAGLGLLIGEGVCGYFYDIDNRPVTSFAYKNGSALLGGRSITQVTRPYLLINESPKVAVLIGGATASSGEAATLAFVGRPNTRLFGTASCGVSTSNTAYDLPFYGYKLNLFTHNMADRTGKVYGSEIMPDQVITDDQIIGEAVKWISQ